MTDPRALAADLRELGVPCEVEARAGLALITTMGASATRMATAELRHAALALATEHGFTHIAVELTALPVSAGATVLRD